MPKSNEPRNIYTLRLTPETYQKAIKSAAKLGISFNAWVSVAIAEKLEREPAKK